MNIFSFLSESVYPYGDIHKVFTIRSTSVESNEFSIAAYLNHKDYYVIHKRIIEATNYLFDEHG